MHSKYDNMHKNRMFYVLICINNCIIACYQVPSPRPYFAMSHYFYTIAPLIIWGMGKGIFMEHETKRGLYVVVPNHLSVELSCLFSSIDFAL